MDSGKLLAHIAEDGRRQTVAEHLINTANLANGFARPFGAEAQAELAGLAHDIGKYSAGFQRRRQGSSIRVDHATALPGCSTPVWWMATSWTQRPLCTDSAGHPVELPWNSCGTNLKATYPAGSRLKEN